ncbi:sugar transferase [Modestobacter sp. VKM Ac-2982]|uniref:sugar transferase n=1 Tax=Modestobacter sp. VKM Ac-2981 TaxID=3004135 RepID=UPI0022AA1328|nr:MULTISPECIES: sugar transferase [unclassified Modestobacter]MCZ2824296.1 sugar transferase [Modestobacter sp. VKM Ac-2981]MCZ2854176.1 sugar transferase [Modestobacter sp. VKM Ac-2982]
MRLDLAPASPHNLSAALLSGEKAVTGYAGSKTIWDWLGEATGQEIPLAIIGAPGSGKTTLLRHVAYSLAATRRRGVGRAFSRKIPVLINARDLRSWLPDSTATLSSLIRRSISDLELLEPPEWVETNLRRGRFALLIDGLDELSSPEARRTLVRWLDAKVDGAGSNSVVVSSRPYGYLENQLARATALQVRPFSEKQVAAYVRAWYLATSLRSFGTLNDSSTRAAAEGQRDLLSRLHSNGALFDLAANPLLLTMMANVHRYRRALPGSRAELYGEIFDVFLGRRHEARGIDVVLPVQQKQTVLEHLAYAMTVSGARDMDVRRAVSVVKAPLRRVAVVMTPETFLQHVLETSGLLIERERGKYAFAHLTLQEYLTASHIKERGLEVELAGRVAEPWWHETVRLYCSLSDATPIVRACLKRANDPRLLALAVQCVEEAREVAPELRATINSYMDPADGHTNRQAREIAAITRLQLRVYSDLPISSGRFRAKGPITWLEYQYFLDVTDGNRVPDHWSSPTYPAGMSNEPAVGLRFDDAQAFCIWLEGLQLSGQSYRLPATTELGTGSFELPPVGRRYGSWVSNNFSQLRDSRYWPVLRSGEQLERRITSPEVTVAPQWLFNDLFQLDLSQTCDGCDGDERSGDSLLLFGAHANIVDRNAHNAESSPLIELLLTAWSDTSAVDAGQASVDAKILARLSADYAVAHEGDSAELVARLVRSSKELVGAIELASNRDSSGDIERNRRELFQAARMEALRSTAAALALYTSRTGSASLPAANKLPAGAVRPARLAQVASAVMARCFALTYVELLQLSARREGILEPRESLQYVREPDGSAPEERYMAVLEVLSAGMRRRMWSYAKPVLDRTVAALAIASIAPVLMILALAVMTTSPGPALYRQQRVGLNGRTFNMYKFRTMVQGADRMLADELSLTDATGVLFKIKSDPRVTPLGRILRRYSLDELAQLFNVLLGDMSLVGPRPPLPNEVVKYDDHFARRLLVKPGITGLWQISGRSDLNWEDSIRLDLEYVDRMSPLLDLRILGKTFGAVMRGSGAY